MVWGIMVKRYEIRHQVRLSHHVEWVRLVKAGMHKCTLVPAYFFELVSSSLLKSLLKSLKRLDFGDPMLFFSIIYKRRVKAVDCQLFDIVI